MSIMKIKDLTEQIRGVSYKPSDVVTSDVGLPILRANNIKGNSLSFDDLVFVKPERVSKKQILQNGDIVICASSGSKELVGKAGVFFNNDMYSFGAFCKAVRVKRIDGINSNYVRLYFGSKYYRECIAMSSKGSNINNIKAENIEELSINIPSAEEQNIAVSLLNALISAIEHKKQELSSLDELVKSRFIEMFGNPQINDKSFKTTKFINVVTLQRGYDLPVNKRDNSGDIPVYGSNGLLGFHNQAKIDQGIITGRSGTLGEVYMCDTPFWPLNTTLFSIDTHGNNLIYLQYLLIFYDLRRFASGAGVPTLNRNEFHDNEMISVPIELQNEFAEFVKLIDKSKFIVQQQIKDLQELLDSKMDEYFR